MNNTNELELEELDNQQSIEHKETRENSQKRKKVKQIFKWVLLSIGSVVLIAALFGGYKLYKVMYANKYTDGAMESKSESEQLDYYVEPTNSPEPEIKAGMMPKDEWHQDKVIHTMHLMTHQKIVADTKWGAVEMTPERVAVLHKYVQDTDENDFEHKDTLLAILVKWKAGNFSSVDDDHNILWGLHDGTKGEATGIFTKEQEKDFVERVF